MPIHLDVVRSISDITLLTNEENVGLASNINRGLKELLDGYVVYIQEDFLMNAKFGERCSELFSILDNGDLDMIRLRSNTKFKKTTRITEFVCRIPRFAISNIPVNHYRYSDHPYIVKSDFFERFGMYKEKCSTLYGENEFMVRMMTLNPKIGLVTEPLANPVKYNSSVRDDHYLDNRKSKKWNL